MENLFLDCPTCKEHSMELHQTVIDIPYFGPVQIISTKCSKCGTKTIDYYVIEEQEARRFTFIITKEQQMRCRVIQGPSGTIKIPEFKFLLEPGSNSSGFVSNVEGVLFQVSSTIDTLKRWNPDKVDELNLLANKVELALKGEHAFTLIIEDPTGKSGIIPVSSDDKIKIEKI